MADKNESGIFKVAMNLILTCLVSGCIIGVVFFITGPIATAKAEQMKQDSMKTLVPDADKFVPVQGEEDTFIAEKGGQKVAYIIPTAPKGYGGPIKLLTAVSMDGTVMTTRSSKPMKRRASVIKAQNLRLKISSKARKLPVLKSQRTEVQKIRSRH